MKKDQIRSNAYWVSGGMRRSGTAEDYFPFLRDGKRHVISLVGGGGKSTLMDYLASCFAARGRRTVIMTTTRIACPEHVCMSIEDCREQWVQGRYAACGEKTENGKFRAPKEELLAVLLEEADAIVVEADGAHMMACKAPAEHEPVILPESDIVIGVMGVEVMGCAVEAVCHRPAYVQALLGCAGDHLLTAGDMADIFTSQKGARKNVDDREFYAVINKCDDEARVLAGEKVLLELEKRGQTKNVLTSFA